MAPGKCIARITVSTAISPRSGGLQLRGDERVLDVGCGRGAMLMMTAKALSRGRVVGLDIWSRADQSSNSRASAEANLAAEGVADRCELTHADVFRTRSR